VRKWDVKQVGRNISRAVVGRLTNNNGNDDLNKRKKYLEINRHSLL
jgi:hypothetical protein